MMLKWTWRPSIKCRCLFWLIISSQCTTTAVVKDTPIPQRLEMPSFSPPKHLDPTIYPTEVGVTSVSGKEGGRQMLSTAIKVTLDPQRSVKVRPLGTPD